MKPDRLLLLLPFLGLLLLPVCTPGPDRDDDDSADDDTGSDDDDTGSDDDDTGSDDDDTGSDDDDTGPCSYPTGAIDPMGLGQVLYPYSWPEAIDGAGVNLPLDLDLAPCADDPDIDWSPHDVLLFSSLPVW